MCVCTCVFMMMHMCVHAEASRRSMLLFLRHYLCPLVQPSRYMTMDTKHLAEYCMLSSDCCFWPSICCSLVGTSNC